MRNFMKEFKEFILTGNLIEIAVGLILATFIGAVIKAFVEGVVLNLVAAIVGKPNFDQVARIKLNDKVTTLDDGTKVVGTYLEFGKVITAFITLVIVGLVLFMILKAYNKMRKKTEDVAGPTELDLLTEIRDELRRGRA